MKRYIAVIAAILIMALFILPVAAEESTVVEEITTEVVTETTTETTVEIETEVVIDIGEVREIVENSSSFSEAVIAIAEIFGISVEDGENLVNDMKALGDKYLGETALWVIIKQDMADNPEVYIFIALCLLLLVTIIVFMIRWIISNIGQIRAMKINLAGIKKSVDGDENDQESKKKSLRYLITAKNDEIKALEEKDAALEQEVIKLREEAARLSKEARAVKKNTEAALNIMQETALSIAQLLYIAMDKGKMPMLSKEAKQIWYGNMQANIKAAAGFGEGGESNGSETDETAQKV